MRKIIASLLILIMTVGSCVSIVSADDNEDVMETLGSIDLSDASLDDSVELNEVSSCYSIGVQNQIATENEKEFSENESNEEIIGISDNQNGSLEKTFEELEDIQEDTQSGETTDSSIDTLDAVITEDNNDVIEDTLDEIDDVNLALNEADSVSSILDDMLDEIDEANSMNTASVSEKYQTIKAIIESKGQTDSTGAKYIEEDFTYKEKTYTCRLYAETNYIAFYMFDTNANIGEYMGVTPSGSVVIIAAKGSAQMSTSLNPSTFNPDTVTLKFVDRDNSIPDVLESTLSNLFNSSTKMYLTIWDLVLYDQVGYELIDLGFTYYNYYKCTSLRLYGSNRYSTSLSIANQLKKQIGVSKFNAIILATGLDYPDALAGGYLGSLKNAPIILIRDKAKDKTMVTKWVKANLKKGGTIYVLGSSAAVPDSWFKDMKTGFTVKRLGGKNRFGTDIEILKACGVKSGKKTFIVTTGYDYSDALCASALSYPLLIVNTKKNILTDEQKSYLKNVKGSTFYILGPTSVVSSSIEKALKGYGTVKRVSTNSNAIVRSVQTARQFTPKPKAVALAVSTDFADGLCGGVLANKTGASLLLVKSGSESQATSFVSDKAVLTSYVFGSSQYAVPDKSVKKIFPRLDKIAASEYK